jgi:hypothetical protein
LLLQLATQLAAASNFAFLVSTNQTQVLHQSMIFIPSLAKKKKKKVQVFFYRFLCVKGRSIAFLSISAQKKGQMF